MSSYHPCDECRAYFQSKRQRDLHKQRVHDEDE